MQRNGTASAAQDARIVTVQHRRITFLARCGLVATIGLVAAAWVWTVWALSKG
jgi:hypothetical protein